MFIIYIKSLMFMLFSLTVLQLGNNLKCEQFEEKDVFCGRV